MRAILTVDGLADFGEDRRPRPTLEVMGRMLAAARVEQEGPWRATFWSGEEKVGELRLEDELGRPYFEEGREERDREYNREQKEAHHPTRDAAELLRVAKPAPDVNAEMLEALKDIANATLYEYQGSHALYRIRRDWLESAKAAIARAESRESQPTAWPILHRTAYDADGAADGVLCREPWQMGQVHTDDSRKVTCLTCRARAHGK